jgi:sulfate adenylyltransferase subunit 2
VQVSIDRERVQEEPGHNPSRNALQTVTLLDAPAEHMFEAALGGARRDEEKAHVKERLFSHRDRYGQWDPKNQRPELWTLYNGRKHADEGFRVFPLSNCTEMDMWQYIRWKSITIPALYFAHCRDVLRRDGTWLAVSDVVTPLPNELVVNKMVRFRTIDDMTCTVGEGIHSRDTGRDHHEDRGCARDRARTCADDKRSDAAIEERKSMGYF